MKPSCVIRNIVILRMEILRHYFISNNIKFIIFIYICMVFFRKYRISNFHDVSSVRYKKILTEISENTLCSSKCRIKDRTSRNGLTKIKRQTLFISTKCNSEIKLRVKTENERCGPFISIKSKVTLHCWTMELN
jgi:hypothetical protein